MERHTTFWKMRVKLADGWHEHFVAAESDKEAFDHMDTAFTGGIEWEIIKHNPITIVEPAQKNALEDSQNVNQHTKFEIEQAVMCAYIDKYGADGKQGEFADAVTAQLPNLC